MNNATAESIQTRRLKWNGSGRFSYTAAVDLVRSMISIVLILISNKVTKKKSPRRPILTGGEDT